jgi:hypothetical protein
MKRFGAFRVGQLQAEFPALQVSIAPLDRACSRSTNF